MSKSSSFTIAVPTFNSGRWIAALARYYSCLEVLPFFFVDSRTTDNTVRELTGCGAQFQVIDNAQPRVESMIGKMQLYFDTPVVLRVDDDECPSRDLIEWLHTDAFVHDNRPAASIARRWLRHVDTKRMKLFGRSALEYAANGSWDSPGSSGGEDRQLRIYKHDEVEYTSDIHTPGFLAADCLTVPSHAVIYHFDWILRDYHERRKKMSFYDNQKLGAGSKMAHFYLPEDTEVWDYSARIYDPNVVELAHRMRDVRSTNRSLVEHKVSAWLGSLRSAAGVS